MTRPRASGRVLLLLLSLGGIAPALCGGAMSLLACNKDPVAPEGNSEPAAAPTPPSPSAPGAQPPAGSAPTAAPSDAVRAGGLQWQDAAPFVRRAPKSSMRAAEYGVTGDGQAELAVFYFGPDQGGSVQDNETRWLGQFTQPDGSDSASKAKRSTRNVGGIEVSLIEVAGNYTGGMAMPGAPAPAPIDDAMMLAAIASGPQGPVFFKLVGPRDAVERSRAGFEQMIGSLR
jgi:hypothetical protein